jgi:hypothetical protein
MEMVYHEARCDVEVGDIVQVIVSGHTGPYLIDEIRLIQYVKANTMTFEFRLIPVIGPKSEKNFTSWLQRKEFIYPYPTKVN